MDKLDDLEKTLEKFTNASKSLDMILGWQKPKNDRLSSGYKSSSPKAKAPFCAKVAHDYNMTEPSR